ncbi:MAG TPA: DUF1566 domain-containing protein [Spirochaetota bacterium]|nr:DUF1566 domain-containing protein [Spirochaetota bacterium]HPS85466.1 DUF1566 domain-containing protein [Spirochaetota bacterium]
MKKLIFTLLFIFIITALYSAKSYRVLSRGTVRDNSTGLIWTRCSLSDKDAPIYDFKCSENRKTYTWTEAVQVCKNLVHEGRSDWRLPSINELQSIIYYNHYATGLENCSQIVEDAFPGVVTAAQCSDNTATIHYWSSTTHINVDGNSKNYIWFADFKWGSVGFTGQDFFGYPIKKYVRCVAGP